MPDHVIASVEVHRHEVLVTKSDCTCNLFGRVPARWLLIFLNGDLPLHRYLQDFLQL